MLMIGEILMLITGAWAFMTGQLPAWLLKILFGKGNYEAEPATARKFGLLLAAPLPLVLLSLFAFRSVWGDLGLVYASGLEFILIIAVSLVARGWAKGIRVQNAPEEDLAQAKQPRDRKYWLRLLLFALILLAPILIFVVSILLY